MQQPHRNGLFLRRQQRLDGFRGRVPSLLQRDAARHYQLKPLENLSFSFRFTPKLQHVGLTTPEPASYSG